MLTDLLILFRILVKAIKYVDEVLSKSIIITKEEKGMLQKSRPVEGQTLN